MGNCILLVGKLGCLLIGKSRGDAIMENTNEKAGSLASLSSEINRLFDQLENHIAPAPAHSVPALESGRPVSNADKFPYRHQLAFPIWEQSK